MFKSFFIVEAEAREIVISRLHHQKTKQNSRAVFG
jgi:hypothetical protein